MFKKSRIIFIGFVLIILLAVSNISFAVDNLKDYQVMLENDHLIFYINSSNANFIIKNKYSEKLWYSNPPQWKENEKRARGKAKDRLGSQLTLTYIDEQKQKEQTINSFSASVAYDQIEINKEDNTVRVDYKLGKVWDDKDYIPVRMTKDRFEKLLNKIKNKEEREFVRNQYNYIYLTKVKKQDKKVDLPDINIRRLLGSKTITSPDVEITDYKDKESFISYFIRQTLNNRYLKSQFEGCKL